jgi:hypothetical protein
MPRSLDYIETGVQSQAAKMEGIEQGYQNEIAELKDALAKKTAVYDFLEGKLAYKTRVFIQQEVIIAKLEEEQVQHVKDVQARTHEIASMQRQITALQEQLELRQYLKQNLEKYQQTLEKSQHLADILSSTLADERAAKRARTHE